MSSVKKQELKFAATSTVRGRTYFSELSFSLDEVNIPADSWIAGQLQILQKKSQEDALPRADIDPYLRLIRLLSTSKEAQQILELPPAKVGRRTLFQLFTFAEHALYLSGGTLETLTRTSSIFRKYILRTAEEQVLLDEDVSRRSIGFKTRFSRLLPPRPLISDLTDKSLDPDLAAPISALTHVNAKDLMVKTELRLERDLVRIQEACIRELEICQGLRERLILLGEKKCTKREISMVGEMIAADKYPLKATRKAIDRLPTDRILSAYQKIIMRDGLARTNRPYHPVFWKNEFHLREFLEEDEKHLVRNGFRIHYLPHRMISQELVASFVLLLTYTGWNGHTLQAMGDDDVTLNGEWVTLRGYKGKIDAFIDDAHLDIKQPGVMMALDLIRWNRKQLIKLGFLSPNSQFLWCTWTVAYGPIEFQYVAFQDGLKKLQERYSLPKFSLDQVRPQVLAHSSLKMKNPEYVRQLASHKLLATTGHYLDQFLLRNMNSAINLEFQRRLENTVLFRLAEKEETFKSLVREKHVDLRLLTPLGDGASCKNPGAPPDDSFLVGNMCDGKRCHLGDGCDNRKIVIDLESLAALVRKRRYYRLNWRRLEHRNSVAFEKFHVPAILFNFSLYDYIKASSFRYYLERVEREIEHETK
ncbi:hypothetical protein [Herbaspirillum frisingense]|uniref:Uncharacterized protein n=1 Tax=Herbaspirillum frisingense TaxID=92645 RepID=A0ABU1PKA8_9BURK|nr:hypothetical protein [Herbaspirillum frisingense]MDR6586366.1 hypothetical protein [Herbaspirillum frisingense]